MSEPALPSAERADPAPEALAARSRILSLAIDAAIVLAAWAGALLVENTALGFLWRDQFSGIWEIALARHVVVPMAVVGFVPAAFFVAAGWRIAHRAAEGARPAVQGLAGVFALALALAAIGITNGRHFESLAARIPFVAVWAGAGAFFGARGVPAVAALAKRPAGLGLLGLLVATAAWLADGFVLPRLYPAFHLALFVTTLLGAALVAFAARADLLAAPRVAGVAAALMAAIVVYDAAIFRRADDVLARATNLRIVLVEHAPLLGRVVARAPRARAEDMETAGAAASSSGPGEVARSLDWTGRDVLLLTIDALRADHVSAYGYARATTPNIDAIAQGGALFEAAYCPTPHTSYSITSMMTGKYLRPLLSLGLGQDSETWAQYLRHYGWRAAAFYPPAVFFIDQSRFTRFEDEQLGFEYAKVEFADPALRERQVAAYLDGAAADHPLFLWVHFFEPHEPYVPQPDHVFSGGPSHDVDAYDGEVATADEGVGRIVRLVQARRPGAVIIVTADHGEEFGDHGGRYHGTTVYEEQVRVPLVVQGPGVVRGKRVASVVQTIDLLPTALSALGIPRPARLRGRDLGPLLGTDASPNDAGFAFAETDDYALVASGPDRLVCERRAAACALYEPRQDPLERHDVSGDDPARLTRLRGWLRATERDHGRYESAGTSAWPEALRRGLQGEVEAAPDVASLLDDADVVVRRKAAELSFALHASATAPEVKRALERDEDDDVRRWCALALARMGEPVPPLVMNLLHDGNRDWRRAAALALGERGEASACDELAAWWADVEPPTTPDDAGDPGQIALDLAHAEELLAATAKGHCRAAVPPLLRALTDVRARPFVADALGEIGDERARGPLLALLAGEPYVTTRPHEARALLALGVRDWAGDPKPEVEATVAAPAGHSRVVALIADGSASLQLTVAGVSATPVETEGGVRTFDLPPTAGIGAGTGPHRLVLQLRASSGGVRALWLVRAAPPAAGSSAADLIDRPESRK